MSAVDQHTDLDADIAAAEADYDRAMRTPRCVGLDEAGHRLRHLYAKQRRLAVPEGGAPVPFDRTGA